MEFRTGQARGAHRQLAEEIDLMVVRSQQGKTVIAWAGQRVEYMEAR